MTEAVLKDYAEELLAAVPFPVERKHRWCTSLLEHVDLTDGSGASLHS